MFYCEKKLDKILSHATKQTTHALYLLCFAIAVLINIFFFHKENFHGWMQTSATILQISLPTYVIVPVLWKRDRQGAIQMVLCLGAILVVTWMFKLGLGRALGLNEIRPSGGGMSFPSGHTAGAFSGAVFLTLRYGWKYALWTLPLAIFVGFSRIYTHDHWPIDVYGSVMLCCVIGLLLVRPHQDSSLAR